MTEPMTNERLAELHGLAESKLSYYFSRETIKECVDEINRLRAENERLLRENLELKMIPVFKEHRL